MIGFILILLTGLEDPNPSLELRRRMEEVMGPLPGKDRMVPADPKTISVEHFDDHTRLKMTIAVEKDDRVPLYLLLPKKVPGRRPAMLCLHQTIPIGKGEPVGLGSQESKRQALHLVRRGYVCVAPDYPSFGEYPYDFSKSDFASGSMKAIWNNLRVMDYVARLPEVDAQRMGVIGHSLGGHHAMFTAVFDDRLKVIVSSCGFCSFHSYYGGNLTGWCSDRYMPRIASRFDKDPKKMPFDFTDIVSSFAPRYFLAVAPIHDDNFAVAGVRSVMEFAKKRYSQLGVVERLQADYPNAGHDFPESSRNKAYALIDRVLH
jgi:dienelactone hydrolase